MSASSSQKVAFTEKMTREPVRSTGSPFLSVTARAYVLLDPRMIEMLFLGCVSPALSTDISRPPR